MKRHLMKRLLPILLCVFVFGSCSRFSEDRTIVFLYDTSESTAPRPADDTGAAEDAWRDYLHATREIISSAGPGTRVMGGLINGKPLRVARVPVSAEFPTYSPVFDNDIIFKDKLLAKKQDALKQIETMLAGEGRAANTCVIDSFVLAEQLLGSGRNTKKAMIVFSDMVEDCDNVDFDKSPRTGARGLPRNQAEVEQLIAELKRQNKIARLDGVEVYVYGATGGQLRDDTAARRHLIQQFWTAFFKSAGAELKEYGTYARPPFDSDVAGNVPLPPEHVATSPPRQQN
jgi:hypothetical protein